ncbi:MAG: hypothetical protein WD942_02500 [Dehalococcoidia bacterium]
MESSTEIQIAWTAKRTNTDTFNIPAPECGCQTWLLFQLVRDYRFTIEAPRWLRRSRITTTEVREKTFHYDLLLDDDPDDPACPCAAEDQPRRSELLSLQIGKLGIRVDAFADADGQYRFRIGSKTYSVEAAGLSSRPAVVALKNLPQVVCELAGVSPDSVDATVEVAPVFDRTDLWSLEGVSVTLEAGSSRDEESGGETQ